MYIKSVKNCNKLESKRVLFRASLNVPIKNGKIKDTFRLDKQLATIRFLRMKGAKIIIVGHLGRPKGGVLEENYSLFPIAEYFAKKLNTKVKFASGLIDINTGTAISGLKEKEIVVLDNLRFNLGEKKNSKRFAKTLASLADLYVCDAFANAHRPHASMDVIKSYLPAYAGLLMEQELTNLHAALKPKKPLLLVLGGSKIATKLPLVNNYKNKAHKILVGGALANNFLKARDFEVGKSVVDEKSIAFAKSYNKDNLVLPIDVVVTKDDKSSKAKVKKLNEVDKDDSIFDIGPETIRLFSSHIKTASTIIWNGPLGFYETRAFRHGSIGIAQQIAARAKGKCFGVVGGGETEEILNLAGVKKSIDWVSTGGGAMLALLGKKRLPGLEKIVR